MKMIKKDHSPGAMKRAAVFLLKVLETVLLVLIFKLSFSPGWAVYGVVGIGTFHFASASLYDLAPLACAAVILCTTFSLLTLWLDHSTTAAAGAAVTACVIVIPMLCSSHTQFTALAARQVKLALVSAVLCVLIGLLEYEQNE